MKKSLMSIALIFSSLNILAAQRQVAIIDAIFALHQAEMIHRGAKPQSVKMLAKYDGDNDFRRKKVTKPKNKNNSNKQLRRNKGTSRKDMPTYRKIK